MGNATINGESVRVRQRPPLTTTAERRSSRKTWPDHCGPISMCQFAHSLPCVFDAGCPCEVWDLSLVCENTFDSSESSAIGQKQRPSKSLQDLYLRLRTQDLASISLRLQLTWWWAEVRLPRLGVLEV